MTRLFQILLLGKVLGFLPQRCSKEFAIFLVQFGKSYPSPGELSFREQVFQRNLRDSEANEGKLNFRMGVNAFSDLTWEEFESFYLMKNVENLGEVFRGYRDHSVPRSLGARRRLQSAWGSGSLEGNPSASNQYFPIYPSSRYSSSSSFPQSYVSPFSSDSSFSSLTSYGSGINPSLLPRRVSWKSRSTPVKDQLRCAACYAFTATAAVEVALGLSHSLSSQEVIDCSTGDNGCVGGNPVISLNYITERGISSESDYEFSGKQGSCKPNKVTFPSFEFIRVPPNILEILSALRQGPVAVLHVASKKLKAYTGGVFSDPDCKGKINHSALLLGYDLEAEVPFIEAKSAWGADWGEGGYYRFAIGPLKDSNPGMCRMLDHKSTVLVTKP